MSKTIVRTCECDSFNCTLRLNLTLEEAKEVERSGLVFIVEGCKTGPNPTNELVEKRDEYSLYKENC